jgi:hypothetical protein
MRGIFGPKREEVAGNCIRRGFATCTLHQIKEDEMGEICTIFWLEETEGKRPFGRPRHRWEDNIRMALREMRWEVVDWILLAQGRDQWRAVVNTVMNLRVP